MGIRHGSGGAASTSDPLDYTQWPANLTVPEWGRRGWNWLHTEAIRYPEAPSRRQGLEAWARLAGFMRRIRCVRCRTHATAWIGTHPPDLRSTHSYQSWVWEFHNAVNRRLSKPEVSYDEYRRLYADELDAAMRG